MPDTATVTESDGKLVFTKDDEFSSPSAAAAVIHGGQANGWISRRSASGETLKEIEEKGLASR